MFVGVKQFVAGGVKALGLYVERAGSDDKTVEGDIGVAGDGVGRSAVAPIDLSGGAGEALAVTGDGEVECVNVTLGDMARAADGEVRGGSAAVGRAGMGIDDGGVGVDVVAEKVVEDGAPEPSLLRNASRTVPECCAT